MRLAPLADRSCAGLKPLPAREPWQFSERAHRRAHEEALQRRHAIDCGKAKIAREANGREIVREESISSIGQPRDRKALDTSPALITPPPPPRAPIEAESCGINDRFGQSGDI